MGIISRSAKLDAAKTAVGFAAAVALAALLGLAVARHSTGAAVAVSVALLGLLTTLGVGVAHRLHRL